MKHEPKLAIHMEKSLRWTHKVGGMVSQEISKVGQTVLIRLMESQIWHWPAIPVAWWEEGSEKGQWPLPTFLTGRKLSPSYHLDARHFSSSLYVTGAFQAAVLVLELRRSEPE